MDAAGQLELLVLSYVAILVMAMWMQWRRQAITVGLPLCYLFSLGMIHTVGAYIHTRPSFANAEPGFIFLGFRETVVGAGAFLLGAAVLAPLVLKRLNRLVLPAGSMPAHNRQLPLRLIGLGLLSYFILVPLLKGVPSVAALTSSGVYLIVAGLNLACWEAWRRQERMRLALYFCSTLLLPFVTIIGMGFIGYGACAALVVVCFVSAFYRPRWHALVSFIFMFSVGMSVFVTYMRDRNELRDKIWNDAALSERLETLTWVFSSFQVIDWQNANQLESIASRLNQNALVSAAIVHLNQGGAAAFARGQTFWEAALAVVPRILWPGKPVTAGSGSKVSEYTGISFAEGTSVGMGHVLEFYVNFGSLGVIVGFLLLGTVLGIMDRIAAMHLSAGDYLGFVSWYLPALGLLQTGGSLVELVGTVFASAILIYILRRWSWLRAAAEQWRPRAATRRVRLHPRRARSRC